MKNKKNKKTELDIEILAEQRDSSVKKDDWRKVFLKIIYQAISDLKNLKEKKDNKSKHHYITAKEFLLNPKYTILYGDVLLSLDEMCELLEVGIESLRKKAREIAIE